MQPARPRRTTSRPRATACPGTTPPHHVDGGICARVRRPNCGCRILHFFFNNCDEVCQSFTCAAGRKAQAAAGGPGVAGNNAERSAFREIARENAAFGESFGRLWSAPRWDIGTAKQGFTRSGIWIGRKNWRASMKNAIDLNLRGLRRQEVERPWGGAIWQDVGPGEEAIGQQNFARAATLVPSAQRFGTTLRLHLHPKSAAVNRGADADFTAKDLREVTHRIVSARFGDLRDR